MQMADKIVMRSVEELIPYARNARTHSDEQVAQIAGSIREFGFTNPLLLDGANGILAGHGRVLAARKLGMTEIPCIELAHLTPAQRRAYIIADNKLALNAGWDTELLKLELEDLKLGGFDLSLTGFGEPELDAIFAEKTQGHTDPDDVPGTPVHPVSQPGDLWLLGAKVTCPNCRKATPLDRAIRK
jgi:ParB-like chromosome segregation protein Spo0J